jgi:hypothetical protein
MLTVTYAVCVSYKSFVPSVIKLNVIMLSRRPLKYGYLTNSTNQCSANGGMVQ